MPKKIMSVFGMIRKVAPQLFCHCLLQVLRRAGRSGKRQHNTELDARSGPLCLWNQ